jgi:hypothetical protein
MHAILAANQVLAEREFTLVVVITDIIDTKKGRYQAPRMRSDSLHIYT